MGCARSRLGIFFATVSPFALSKKARIIIASITTALLAIMNAVFFIIINTVDIDDTAVKGFYEGSDSRFVPLSMVFASVATMVCYALTLFRIKPEKIKTKKPKKSGDKFFDTIKYGLKYIVYGVLRFAKGVLAFKEKFPEIFILIMSILLTRLSFFTSFVVAIACLVIFIAVLIMCFAKVIDMSYSAQTPANNGGVESPTDAYYKKTEYTYTDNYGYMQTVYSSDKKIFTTQAVTTSQQVTTAGKRSSSIKIKLSL